MMGPGPERRQLSEGKPTYVAMLVPGRFLHCVCYAGEKIDLGKTLVAVLNSLRPSERAVELGGQTFNLSYEIHLAKVE